MSYVDRETRFRHRLDDLVETLTSEDIAELKDVLEKTASAPTAHEPTTRHVEKVLQLLDEAHRAEVDERQVAEGTTASMRAHLLARIASPPAEIREIDPLHDAGA